MRHLTNIVVNDACTFGRKAPITLMRSPAIWKTSIAIIALCWGCSTAVPEYRQVSGEIMGTYYRVTYLHDAPVSSAQILSVLEDVNAGVNLYQVDSEISRFNQWPSDSLYRVESDAFRQNVDTALQLYHLTGQHFNPAIAPLVYYWGFGHDRKKITEVDQHTVDSLLRLSEFTEIMVQRDASGRIVSLTKGSADQALDLNAIAKGYAVDQVSEYLKRLGIGHYLVDIGGELRAQGTNPKGRPWTLSINKPDIDASLTDSYALLQLQDHSVATSGNYRNQYSYGDSLIVHTINPITGYSEINDLLSATIVAPDCMRADALATACMVMGMAQAMQLIDNIAWAEAYFIFTPDGITQRDTMTAGMSDLILP